VISRAVVIALVVVGGASAQPTARRLTTVQAIRQYPGYFHLQAVVLRGELVEAGERVTLRSDENEMRVLLGPSAGGAQTRLVDGPIEIRAQLVDVGRLEPGDPRVADYIQADREGWPRPGEELFLRALGIDTARAQATPSIRALALEPWKFEGQTVTLVGQFRGRNLFGDQPDAPKKSRYDFVLRSADASVWVTGLRPRGRGFDLNVDARVDTSNWVEVSGVVGHERGLVTIAASKIAAASAPEVTASTPVEVEVALPPPPPVEVVFSSPSPGETDVSPKSPVRIQFSRSIAPETLEGKIRIAYAGAESAERGEPQAPGIEIKTSYDPGTRALELTFTRPLERFRTVRVQLLEGIKAFDGAPVAPWTLMFSVGG
jgi:hypothetical protein